jgi:hypothetical protein
MSPLDVTPNELAVLRSLRLKGRATTDDLATATRLPPSTVRMMIDKLLGGGDLRELRDAYALLPPACSRLEALLEQERAGLSANEVTALYAAFAPVNADFKAIANQWQMRDGKPNDHHDPAYDRSVLDRLPGIHARVLPIVERLGELAPRLSPYATRLAEANERVRAGQSEWLLTPLIDSYHTVWFELHEELISLAGLTRLDEAAAGRAS